MMNTIRLRSEIPIFLGCALSLAVYILVSPGNSNDWMLDPLTGLVATVAGLAACSQLVRAASDRRTSLLWGTVVVVLALVCLAQFVETLSKSYADSFIGDAIDDYLLLVVAPLMLWVMPRSDPVFARARRVALFGFAIQLAGTLLDLRVTEQEVSGGPVFWSLVTDFAEFVSVSLYLLAVFWIVFETSRALGLISEVDGVRSAVSGMPANRRLGSFRDHLYPPPFLLGWHLPPADTPSGRVHRLCNEAQWPQGDAIVSARNLTLIALWPAVAAVRALKLVRKVGRVHQQFSGKSQSRQFLEQVKLAVCYRILPIYYYNYELYLPELQALAAQYLMRYETKEIAYRLLYPTDAPGYTPTPLRDKAGFARHCQTHGLKHTPTLYVFTEAEHSNRDLPRADLFMKPVTGKGGSGAERWNYVGNGRYQNPQRWELTESELVEHFQAFSRFVEPCLVQPAFRNHQSISDLSPGALCTARMLTCRTEDGDFELTAAAFRMASDPQSAVDNFHAGGVAASIDVKTGQLGRATGLETQTGTVWHDCHPFTGAPIAGRQLPLWQEAVDLVVKAHRAFNDYALIGWDVALLDDGPTLIEGNRGPDVDIHQRTGKGPIGDGRFGALLAYNLEHRRSRPQSP
jgi:Sugar-transfer associated ATP-grasp